MNQALSHEEKDRYYQKMMKSKPFSALRRIDKSCYAYFSNWYNAVVREVVEYVPQPLDLNFISKLITPAITCTQVKKALDLLLSLGLIEENEKGKYRKTDALLTTGREVQSVWVANFHKQMVNLALNAIDHLPAEERDISGIVMSINSERIAEIKEKISDFRNELIELAAGKSDENQVVYIQICAFPLTRSLEGKQHEA